LAAHPPQGATGRSKPSQWRHQPLRVEVAEYDFGDAAGTVRGVPHRWRWITEGLVEIPGGVLVAMEAIADVLRSAGGKGDHLEQLSDSVQRELGLMAIEHGNRTKLVDVLGENHPLTIATEECDRLLSVAGRAVAAEVGVPTEGRLVGVHISGGGAPKSAVPSAQVGARGLLRDEQATRDHHGRPFQAVSLYCSEAIDELRAQGHPVEAGALGENLTVAGIDWRCLRPGVRLAVGGAGSGGDTGSGDPVVLEVSSWAPPCRNIATAFADRRFDRVDHDKNPGYSRAYAWPLTHGTVKTGDTVTVLP
jgi:MOSC domain-containing protein YiiM